MPIHPRVTIHGKQYEIIANQRMTGLGTRFDGRIKWLLKDEDGKFWQALGKKMVWNIRLMPAPAHAWPNHMPQEANDDGRG